MAGVHFPIDCRCGRLIGDSLASYLLSACGVKEADGVAWRGGSFDGPQQPVADFSATALPFQGESGGDTSADAAVLPLYAHLWDRARLEWPATDGAVPAGKA